MSEFNEQYEHFAQDETRSGAFLALKDLRRKAVQEMMRKGSFQMPKELLTDDELMVRKAEAAYALGAEHLMDLSKLPDTEGNEAYAAAVCATQECPYCTALCLQAELEKLYTEGAPARSRSGHARFYIVAVNGDETAADRDFAAAVEGLRIAYPDFLIVMDSKAVEEVMGNAMAQALRGLLDECKTNRTDENLQKVAAALMSTPLVFPAQRAEEGTPAKDGEQLLQFAKTRAKDGNTFFMAFTDRAQLLKWREFGSVELAFKDYAPIVLQSQDTGIVLDPFVGSGLAITQEMIRMLQAQYEMFSQMMEAFGGNAAADAGDAKPEDASDTKRRPFWKKK